MTARARTKISDTFFRKPGLLTAVLLLPPVIWIVVVYLGSLLALLLQSFYALDDFSGIIIHEVTLSTYGHLFDQANREIIIRTVLMATAVTFACAVIAFPIAYYAARYARGTTKALFYLAVMMPLSRAISSKSMPGNSSSPKKASSRGLQHNSISHG